MGTLIIGIIVFVIIGFAVYKVYKDSKSGKCDGGCDCCNGCHSDDTHK